MKYAVDIDGTICTMDNSGMLNDATPIAARIEQINRLVDEGHEVTYWTARGAKWENLTRSQLTAWGAKFTDLQMEKRSYDQMICDKVTNASVYFDQSQTKTIKEIREQCQASGDWTAYREIRGDVLGRIKATEGNQ